MLIKIGDAWVDPEEVIAVRELFSPGVDNSPCLSFEFRSGSDLAVKATLDEAEAALIDAGYIESPYPDPEAESPELTEDERTELEAFDAQGFTWLARDADGKVFAYKEKPALEDGYYFAPGATQPVQAAGDYLFLDPCDAMEIGFLLRP